MHGSPPGSLRPVCLACELESVSRFCFDLGLVRMVEGHILKPVLLWPRRGRSRLFAVPHVNHRARVRVAQSCRKPPGGRPGRRQFDRSRCKCLLIPNSGVRLLSTDSGHFENPTVDNVSYHQYTASKHAQEALCGCQGSFRIWTTIGSIGKHRP